VNQLTDNSLFQKITSKKQEIDSVQYKWDSAKKISNDYEYIYTSSNSKKNISSIIPVSRSFFKLREIIYDFSLDIAGKSGCIAEAPGGFIQSILMFCESNRVPLDVVVGITLIDDNKEIPYWNPLLLHHDKIHLCAGMDGTGDLYKLGNVVKFINTCGKSSCSLVTGDGGFDYTHDFEQELASYRLLYSEVMIALNIQAKGGTFVCKMFDLFWYSTLQLVFLLYISYEKISFIKPSTSRQSNSEKYIVCQGFKGYHREYSNIMCQHFGKDILPIDLPQDFIHMIQTYHTKYVRHQIQRVDSTLQLISQRRNLDKPSQQQIKLAVEWCKKYDIPVNTQCYYIR
jgi:cap1 methyltransferase